jgi:ABC-type multidrug transport system ATPase subunit
MIALISPSTISLTIDGIEPYRNREKTLKSPTFLFEKPKLPYRMRVKEFVDFTRSSPDVSQNFQAIPGRLGLMEFANRRLYELSSGKEQPIALFAAFARDSQK